MTRKVNWKKPKRIAEQVVKIAGIKQPPVPVEEVARIMGVEIDFQPADEEISGFAYRKGSQVIIGINEAHPETRQRFTIAHELGHCLLHDRDFFIDSFTRFRDKTSARAVDPDEIEANAFASELLMPEMFLLRDIKKINTSQTFDQILSELAERYNVSQQAMSFRLNKMNFLTFES